ncbi:hypothetical protein [Peterkaempfera sp. SMS 1(5)a]|uniref:hypothetical protein n=1 Tax=Peterkaempfera podocarpi TaxID=3232308 RepID=UPI0036718D00
MTVAEPQRGAAQSATEVPPQAVRPPAVPPRHNRRLQRIAGGVVLGLTVLAAGTPAAFADGGEGGIGQYTLVPPAAFHGLVWMDDSDAAKGAREALQQNTYPPGVTPLGTAYGRDGQVTLVISGVSGPVADPAAGLSHGFMNLESAGTMSARQDFYPGRLGGELQCAEVTMTDGTLSACAWADHSSVVMVVTRVDKPLPAFAAQTRQLRAAMEVEK